MTDEPRATEPDDSPDVLAHMAFVAHRVATRIAEDAFSDPREREAAVKAAEQVLLDDEGARALLEAAFDEGRRDAAKAMLRTGGPTPAPDWSDVESPGERRAIAREDSICGSCSKAPVCVVARAASAELLVVITRCAAHG